MSADESPDWLDWFDRWDSQQQGYVPEREERFAVMFDALEQLLPPSFTALDLACGPGSLSKRLLARFPAARVIAVDFDPAMLALGRGALGTAAGRLHFVDADLGTPGWVAALPDTPVDVALSTTALHWLEPEPLRALYRDLAELLPDGGLFLNGDHLSFSAATPVLARLADQRLGTQWTDESFAARGIETAEQWWAAFSAQPALAEVLRERERRYATKTRQDSPPGYDDHVAALAAAGFREIGTIWQHLSDRVLLAVR